MRLKELFTPSEKTLHYKKPHDIEGALEKRNATILDPIGSKHFGYYSQGRPSRSDPFVFNKETHLPSNLQNDAYYQYIMASKEYAPSNPYFPRVYGITYKKDPNGLIKPRYAIEKFIPLSALTPEELSVLVDRIFITPNMLSDINNKNLASSIGFFIKRIRFNAMHGDVRARNIKDKKLLQAFQLIDGLIASNGNFAYDLHENNFMVRRTPVGPQLVLMDPIDDSGASIVGEPKDDEE